MAKKEKINKEQEELKQRRQYNIDHNLPSEELKDIRKNLWLHNTLYKIMSLFNTISGFEKDFERYKFDFNGKKTAIQLSDIIYLESFLHEITIHTSSNFYKYSSTFNKMMSLINSTNIVRIHKSYAVNLFWVKEIYKEKLLLRNGVTLKIGKKYQQDVLASYKEYLLK